MYLFEKNDATTLYKSSLSTTTFVYQVLEPPYAILLPSTLILQIFSACHCVVRLIRYYTDVKP